MFKDPLSQTYVNTKEKERERESKEIVYSCYFAQFNLGLLHVYNDHQSDITSRENEKV